MRLPRASAAGDLDGDGREEIAVVSPDKASQALSRRLKSKTVR
jgi:hypothetical protein